MHFYYNNVAQAGTMLSVTGARGISIALDTTIVSVEFMGLGGAPAMYDVMRAIGGSINSICGTNPPAYNAELVQLAGNWLYRLRRA